MRHDIASMRKISLTSSKVTTKYVLDFMVEDSFKENTHCILSTDAWGQKCVIFVDTPGFVVDYSAFSYILDVMSYSAHSPCVHCTFGKLELSAQINVSRYAQSCDIEREYSSFAGEIFRLKALRTAKIKGEDCNVLRTKPGGDNNIQTSVLRQFLRWSDAIWGSDARTFPVLYRSPLQNKKYDSCSQSGSGLDHLVERFGGWILVPTLPAFRFSAFTGVSICVDGITLFGSTHSPLSCVVLWNLDSFTVWGSSVLKCTTGRRALVTSATVMWFTRETAFSDRFAI